MDSKAESMAPHVFGLLFFSSFFISHNLAFMNDDEGLVCLFKLNFVFVTRVGRQ